MGRFGTDRLAQESWVGECLERMRDRRKEGERERERSPFELLAVFS